MEENHCIIKKSGVTHVKIKQFKYTWTIKNFANCISSCGQSISSPNFTTGERNELMWRLELYPNGWVENYKDFLSIRPYFSSTKLDLYQTTIVLSVIDRRGIERNVTKRVVDGNSFHGYGVVFYEFVKRDYLFDEVNGLLPDDNLTIVCKMYANQSFVNETGPTERKPVSKPIDEDVPADRRLLELEDFERLWVSEQLSDVELVVGEEKDDKFRVHKCILAAKSPAFAAMFEEAGNEKTVEIDNIESDVMLEVLRFIYYGEVYGIKSLNICLLYAAIGLELNGLKNICEEVLIDQLSVNTVSEILLIVDRFDTVDKLRASTIDFLKENSKEVIKDEKLKTRMKTLSSTLLADVADALMSKM